MLSDKFEFINVNNSKETVYTAVKEGERYLITWFSDGKQHHSYDVVVTVINIIDSGFWKIIKEYENIKDDKLINYIIEYKHPKDSNGVNHRFKFKGVIENFNPNGLCAFVNDDGEKLLVRYTDIIQMRPLKGE